MALLVHLFFQLKELKRLLWQLRGIRYRKPRKVAYCKVKSRWINFYKNDSWWMVAQWFFFWYLPCCEMFFMNSCNNPMSSLRRDRCVWAVAVSWRHCSADCLESSNAKLNWATRCFVLAEKAVFCADEPPKRVEIWAYHWAPLLIEQLHNFPLVKTH